MAYTKKIVSDKVDANGNKKFKIKKEKGNEIDIDIEIDADGDYIVDKLSTDDLPSTLDDGTTIRWFNNFSIRKKIKKIVNGSEVEEPGDYINQTYKVKIPGAYALNGEGKKLVLFDGNTNNGKPYVFPASSINSDDTIELTDGDPAIGGGP